MFGHNLVYTSLCVDCSVKSHKIMVFPPALSARFIWSLMRIQHPKPRYDPFPFSISSLLLKELSFSFYTDLEVFDSANIVRI